MFSWGNLVRLNVLAQEHPSEFGSSSPWKALDFFFLWWMGHIQAQVFKLLCCQHLITKSPGTITSTATNYLVMRPSITLSSSNPPLTFHIIRRSNHRREFTHGIQSPQLTHSVSWIIPNNFYPYHSLKSHSFSSNLNFNSPITKKIKYLSLNKKDQMILLVKKSHDKWASWALESLILSV